jgi:hypothetical protein
MLELKKYHVLLARRNHMELLGTNFGILIINLLLVGSWPLFSIFALLGLRRRPLTGTNQALWALLVVAVPVLGALAFFIMKPGENDQT